MLRKQKKHVGWLYVERLKSLYNGQSATEPLNTIKVQEEGSTTILLVRSSESEAPPTLTLKTRVKI